MSRSVNSLLPLVAVDVESGCKSVGRLFVEVVFRNAVGLVVNKRKRSLDVPAYFLIVLLKSATGVARIQSGLGFVHICHAQIFRSILGMIWKAVNHCQTKMCVSPAEQSLALIRKDLVGSSHIFDCPKRSICGGNHLVVALPGVDIALVACLGNRLPGIVLLNQSVRIVVRTVEQFHIVGGVFEKADVSPCGIGRNKQFLNFLL